MIMVRKIFKIGDSLVIALSEDVIEQLGLREGSEVSVSVEAAEGRLIIELNRPAVADIEPTFARQLDEFIQQYGRRLKLWRNDVLERFTMMVVGERPSLNTIAVWFEANCKLIL